MIPFFYRKLFISVFFIISILIFQACGKSPLQEASNFIPNRAPVISAYYSNVVDRDLILPDDIITLTVEVADPDGDPLTYEFDSDQGSFRNLQVSDTGCTIDLVITSELTGEQPVYAQVTVTDIMEASASDVLDIGTGMRGPAITLIGEINEYVRADGSVTLQFKSNHGGLALYRIGVTDTDPGEDVAFDDFGDETSKYPNNERGFCTDDEIITITINGSPDASYPHLSAATPVPSADYAVIVVQDSLGGETFKKLALYADDQPPVVELKSASQGALDGGTFGAISDVSISATDNSGKIGEIGYWLDSSPDEVSQLDSDSLSISQFGSGDFPDGSHDIEYYAIDKAGNLGLISLSNFNVDTGIPTAKLGPVTGPGSIEIYVGRDDGVVTYTYSTDGGLTWSGDTLISVTQGATGMSNGDIYNIRVRGKDIAKNEQITPTPFSWTYDTDLPIAVLSGISPSDSLTLLTTISMDVTGVSFYKYKLDDFSTTNWDVQTVYAGSTSISEGSLSDGLHTIVVRGGADNTDDGDWQAVASATYYSWTVDATDPIASLYGLPKDPTILDYINIKVSKYDKALSYANVDVVSYRYNLDSGGWSAPIDIDTTPAINASGLIDGSHTLLVRAIDKAGNEQGDGVGTPDQPATEYTWTVDTTPPDFAAVSPPNNTFLALSGENAVIRIDFNEEISEKLKLYGSLGKLAVYKFQDIDTLLVYPEKSWETLGSASLTVYCMDLAGNAVERTLKYEVVNGVVYVSENGAKGNPGTRKEPMRYITNAVKTAYDSKYETGAVMASNGTWETAKYPLFQMLPGISVYGGFNDTFDQRDPGTHISILRTTTTESGTEEHPASAVEVPSGIKPEVVLDGFTVTGGSGKLSSAIFIGEKSAVTISNNNINGGTAKGISYGIFNLASEDATIRNNIINGGGSGAESSIGIRTYASNKIYNNVIQAGSAISFACGIHVLNASPYILSNTIINGLSSGDKSELFGIYMSALTWNSYPYIINNIIVSFDKEKVPNYGIFAYAAKGMEVIPEALVTNDIYSPYSIVMYRDYKGNEFTEVKYNISLDPGFEDQPNGNYHLTVKYSPKEVVLGGADLSGKFFILDDLDGNERTDPWSIGAYELNYK